MVSLRPTMHAAAMHAAAMHASTPKPHGLVCAEVCFIHFGQSSGAETRIDAILGAHSGGAKGGEHMLERLV